MTQSPQLTKDEARERVRGIAAEFKERGDQLGWFDAVYASAEGELDKIPWADLEPNPFFRAWAESKGLRGEGKKALVVGCGLGDDAKYLDDLGFRVTAFDISPAAIKWAKRLHADTEIQFEVADLFQPDHRWLSAFDFVLEIYTIQPLPMDLRARAIDAVASFVAAGGELVVICRGRENDEEVNELPYPLSPADLGRFEENGLIQAEFKDVYGDEDPPERRFVVEYQRPPA